MIVGLDKHMIDLGARIGFGSREGTFREELFRIFGPLMKDPYFPKFDVPMLAAKISKIPNREGMICWLVMMGAKSDTAIGVVDQLLQVNASLTFYDDNKMASEADQWSGLLDTSMSNTSRIICIEGTTSPVVLGMLRGFGGLLARCWPYCTSLRKMNIFMSVNDEIEMLKMIYPGLFINTDILTITYMKEIKT